MQFHPIPFFKHQARGHKPFHQLIGDHLQPGKANRERTELCKPRRMPCTVSFLLSSQGGQHVRNEASARTQAKGWKSLMENKRSHQDSALMQKVLAVLQSFLGDRFCCKRSPKKGRFSIAESFFPVTDVIGTLLLLSTARKHVVTLLANAKRCRPPEGLRHLDSRRTCSAQGPRPVQCTGLELRPSLSQISNPVSGLHFWESPECGNRGHKPRQHILVNAPASELLSEQNQRPRCHLAFVGDGSSHGCRDLQADLS